MDISGNNALCGKPYTFLDLVAIVISLVGNLCVDSFAITIENSLHHSEFILPESDYQEFPF